ncbi:MAG: hypothetical protein Q9P01_00805 [Anaerolineae bacterium]|nr:hypothetical protein [Anaerolineae bacterium]MDQ7033407.1 hypothetical protein [Anaerolineae bacterium]
MGEIISQFRNFLNFVSKLGAETDMTIMPKEKTPFTIRFSDTQFSPALRVDPDEDAQSIIDTFALITPRPALFITGGAGLMTDDDIQRTREIMNDGIAKFAAIHNLTVIDGGTEAGVMQMIGEARKTHGYHFPLIGCAPYYKVTYPGAEPREGIEATLEDGHSHFVLVNSHEWGGESQMIVKLTRAIAAHQRPMIGVLINGGSIAERDVYYATAIGDNRVPILILDGSGRTADNISTAFKTNRADSQMIRAIIKGGDIRLTPLSEGVPALLKHLSQHFGVG